MSVKKIERVIEKREREREEREEDRDKNSDVHLWV